MERTLPNNAAAERATIGSIFLDREAIVTVAALLEPAHFYYDKHAWVYEAQLACYSRREPPDLTLVANELRRRERLEQIGGVPFLIDLANDVPTAFHAEYYAKIVERTAVLRRLIRAGGEIAALGFEESDDLDRTIARAFDTLLDVARTSHERGFQAAADVFDDVLADMERRVTGQIPPALETPWIDVNRAIGGLRRGELIVLTSPSGTGKSTMMCQLLHHCVKGGGHAGGFSLEMTRGAVLKRILADALNLPYEMLRDHVYTTAHERWQASNPSSPLTAKQLADLESQRINALYQARETLVPSWELDIDDTPDLTIDQIRLRAVKRAALTRPFDLLAVDYAQLAKATRRHQTREQEVAEVADGLLAMAKELDCPVLALAQQNESGDVRESRRLFNNCHVEMRLKREESEDSPYTHTLVVTKARDGQLENVPLQFDGAHQRFTTYTPAHSVEGY